MMTAATATRRKHKLLTDGNTDLAGWHTKFHINASGIRGEKWREQYKPGIGLSLVMSQAK